MEAYIELVIKQWLDFMQLLNKNLFWFDVSDADIQMPNSINMRDY